MWTSGFQKVSWAAWTGNLVCKRQMLRSVLHCWVRGCFILFSFRFLRLSLALRDSRIQVAFDSVLRKDLSTNPGQSALKMLFSVHIHIPTQFLSLHEWGWFVFTKCNTLLGKSACACLVLKVIEKYKCLCKMTLPWGRRDSRIYNYNYRIVTGIGTSLKVLYTNKVISNF